MGGGPHFGYNKRNVALTVGSDKWPTDTDNWKYRYRPILTILQYTMRYNTIRYYNTRYCRWHRPVKYRRSLRATNRDFSHIGWYADTLIYRQSSDIGIPADMSGPYRQIWSIPQCGITAVRYYRTYIGIFGKSCLYADRHIDIYIGSILADRSYILRYLNIY